MSLSLEKSCGELTPASRAKVERGAVIAMLTALVAIGGVVFHLVGEETHRAYLRYWNVDTGLFPKSTDWLLINAYYGSVIGMAQAINFVLKYWVWAPVVLLALAWYLWILMSPFSLARLNPDGWKWLPKKLVRPAAFVVAAAGIMVVLLVTLCFAFIVAIVPAKFGDHVGQYIASSDARDFREGCERSKASCVVLRKDGKDIASGYVLDSSPSHVAVFDVELKRARSLPRDGIETLSLRPIQ